MTLNEIVFQITDSLDRPHDPIFTSRVADMVMTNRNVLLHRLFDKNGIDSDYVQQLVITLEPLIGNTPNGINNLKSTTPVPKPLRLLTPTPYLFLGTIDHRVSYQYIKYPSFKHIAQLPLIGNGFKYTVDKDYPIINKANVGTTTLLIEYVSERMDIKLSNSEYATWSGDNQFPIYDELIPTIIDMVRASLRTTKDVANEQIPTTKDQA